MLSLIAMSFVSSLSCCLAVHAAHDGSMLATAAMTSEIMLPSHIAATACRLLNDGSRKWTRYGRVPPELTRWQPSSPLGDSTAA